MDSATDNEPFGPTLEEYLPGCPVCGTACVVHEAIVDAGIGRARVRQGVLPSMYAQGGVSSL